MSAASRRCGGAGGMAELRVKLAGAVGFAARRMWRRSELEEADLIVLDLLVEALARMGRLCGPRAGAPAADSLAAAPRHVKELVEKVVPLATRVEGQVVSPATPAAAAVRPRSRTPPKARSRASKEAIVPQPVVAGCGADTDADEIQKKLVPLEVNNREKLVTKCLWAWMWATAPPTIDSVAEGEECVQECLDAIGKDLMGFLWARVGLRDPDSFVDEIVDVVFEVADVKPADRVVLCQSVRRLRGLSLGEFG